MQDEDKRLLKENTTEAIEGLPDNIEELKGLLLMEKEKAQSYLASWQRAAADLINYKRRAEQEKTEARQLYYGLSFSKILPVLDDIEKALACRPDIDEAQKWIEGIELIHRKFLSILESEGVSIIKTVGENFDPFLHEAVMQGEGEPGKIISDVRKGYKLNGNILRPAQVVVGKEQEEK